MRQVALLQAEHAADVLGRRLDDLVVADLHGALHRARGRAATQMGCDELLGRGAAGADGPVVAAHDGPENGARSVHAPEGGLHAASRAPAWTTTIACSPPAQALPLGHPLVVCPSALKPHGATPRSRRRGRPPPRMPSVRPRTASGTPARPATARSARPPFGRRACLSRIGWAGQRMRGWSLAATPSRARGRSSWAKVAAKLSA